MNVDRLLTGGLLLDGLGTTAVEVDIAISGTTVAALIPRGKSAALQAGDRIACDGMVIAPAFLDTHSHSDLKVITDPGLPMKVAQGIGLDVLGQDGIGVAPQAAHNRPQMARTIAGLDGTYTGWQWTDIAGYFEAIEQARPAIHVATLVPHGNIRLDAIGMADRPASADELQAMAAALENGLEQGAIGLSTGLIYPPCCYGPTDELVFLGRVLARHDRPLVVHMRSESDYILDAVDEMLAVARQSGCRVHISHIKIAGRRNWGQAEAMVNALDRAWAEGLRVTADQYPYTAGSTMMGAILPPWAHAGGVEQTLQHLNNADSRTRIKAALLAEGPHSWDNFWSWAGAEGIYVADVASGRRPEIIGKNLSEIAGSADPVDEVMDLLRDEAMGVSMIAFSQSEDVIAALMAHPRVNGCTDGLLLGKPHPRCYGAFPRILGRYVRDRGICALPEAIRKLTSQAAEALTLPGRGVVAVGAPADLVVFDPATVADRATYADPRQYPVGMPHVLIHGEPVLRDGAFTGARPGTVVRGRVGAA